MVFSSTIFLFIFLPLFLAIYYVVPKHARSIVILTASYIFYAWWRIDFVLLFICVTLFNYGISYVIVKYEIHAKKIMICGVIGNLMTLGYFKYFNFGADSMNALFGYVGIDQFTAWNVILPIGISFYIFQAISYLIDIYRKDAQPADNFIDFAAFISLFPQLIAGPVLRYKDVADQFRNRTHTHEKFTEGAVRFSMGFCKKVFIADTLAPIADNAFALENPTMMDSWVGILAYTAQLYFDFSGYSDMAIGLGLMMGFRFIENFNHPYISQSITEFWKKWHISLSTWLRDYLYIPLGGNRHGRTKTYQNIVITMVLGGLWHGANWTFILWGFLHGGFMVIERLLTNGDENTQPWPKIISLPLTFIIIMMGWVLFRASDIKNALSIYVGMIGKNGFYLSDTIQWQITNLQYFTLVIAYIIIFAVPFLMHTGNKRACIKTWAYELSFAKQAIVAILFIIAISKLISQSFSPFLYFQF